MLISKWLDFVLEVDSITLIFWTWFFPYNLSLLQTWGHHKKLVENHQFNVILFYSKQDGDVYLLDITTCTPLELSSKFCRLVF